jgi:hypothetical protein
MEDETAPLPLTLTEYLAEDHDLRLRLAEQQRINENARALGRKWSREAFAEEVTLMAQFVSERPTAGRALLLGIAIKGDLMMVVTQSLAPLLRLQERSLHRYFTMIGWRSAGPAILTREEIRDTFGSHVLVAALQFKLKIHYRIRCVPEPAEDSTRQPGAPRPLQPARCLEDDEMEPPVFNPEVLVADDHGMLAAVLDAVSEFSDECSEPTQPTGNLPYGDPGQSTPPPHPGFECRLDDIWVARPDGSPESQGSAGDFPSDDPDQAIPSISPSFECESEEIWVHVPDESPEWQERPGHFPAGDPHQPMPPIAPSFEREWDRIRALEAIIQQKDQLLADYEQSINTLHEEMREMSACLARAEDRVEALTTDLCEREAKRNKIIDKIREDNHYLAVTDRNLRLSLKQRDRKIEVLAMDRAELARELDGPAPHAPVSTLPANKLSNANPQERQVLWLFYQGEDLDGISDMTDLNHEEIFRMLQALIVPATSELENEIDVPAQWDISLDMLRDPVRRSEHLFSEPVLQGLESCGGAQELARLLTQSFWDFSQRDNPDWQQMAFFVMEMAVVTAVRVHGEKSREELQERITTLQSTRGKLMHDCRQIRQDSKEYVDALKKRLANTEAALCRLRGEIAADIVDLGTVRPSDSAVRTDLFHEMVHLAQREKNKRRYTDLHYYLAVLLLFRSRSSYEQIHTKFFPSPAPSSIYDHFHDTIQASLKRLKSLDEVEPYLLARIAAEPLIHDGAVIAVDAISCSSTFVGMKRVEEGKIAYLFVVYLQPLRPEVKCTPLFVIESKSGMATGKVQRKIDAVLAAAQATISRVFLASDGDGSYNDRHHAFMAFWEPIFQSCGFDRVLEILRTYTGVLPLSDLLHLAKNFRTRMLRYLLTFCIGKLSKSADPEVMRRILGLKGPLTDLTQLGKMRDAYPLVIARVEHINKLFQNDAIAEAVVWLPLCLSLNAVRLENITPSTRVFMLRISWFLVWHIYDRKRTRVDTGPQLPTKKIKLGLTIFTSQWSIRYLDTIMLFTFSIENYDIIALDRESTHPLENFFGFVRMDGHDVNTAEQTESTIAHTDLVKEAMEALELAQTVPGRENLAGVQLGTAPPDKVIYSIEMENGMSPEAIALICLKAVHVVEAGLDPDEEIAFLQFRHYLTLLQRAADDSKTSREINQRFSVTSAARIVHLVVSHGAGKLGPQGGANNGG